MPPSSSLTVLTFLLGIALICAPGSSQARDGDPDPDFGIAGSVIMPFPGDLAIEESFVDVQILPNGKLLVSATVRTGTGSGLDMGVMRLHADGTLDTGFGEGGARLVGFDRVGSDNTDYVRGMAIQADGRIVLVGEAAGAIGGADMAVARLTADGDLDASFGAGGKTTIAFDLGASPERRADQGVKIALRPDGRMVVSGLANSAAGALMAVARLTAGGVLDTSFDGDGKRTLAFGGGLADVAIGYEVIVAADGLRTYVVGVATLATNLDFAVARLLDNGTPDPTFGGDGTVTFGFDISGTFGDAATSIIELPDGKVQLCGTSLVSAPRNSDFSCMRLLSDGTVDPDFPPVLVPFNLDGQGSDQAFSGTADEQGRTVLVGYASIDETSYDAGVVRLLPSGQVDPAFGVDGRMAYDATTNGADGFNRASALVIQPDGKIVVAGSARMTANFDHHVQLIRVIGDGLFDSGFDLPEL